MRRFWGSRHAPITYLFAAALLALIVSVGCGAGSSAVNVAEETDLDQATVIEIAERAGEEASTFHPLVTVADEESIQQVVALLDNRLPLGPRARCLGRYRLRFQLEAGQAVEFEYYCQEGASFLRGDQVFWKGQQIEPPVELDQLIQHLLP